MKILRVLRVFMTTVDLTTGSSIRSFLSSFLSRIAIVLLLAPGAIFTFIHAAAFVQTGDIVIDSLNYDAVGRYLLCLALLKLAAILIGIDGFIEEIKGEDNER